MQKMSFTDWLTILGFLTILFFIIVGLGALILKAVMILGFWHIGSWMLAFVYALIIYAVWQFLKENSK